MAADSAAERHDPEMVLGQAKVNELILQIISRSTERLFWITMMSELSEPRVVEAVRGAMARGVRVEIFHSENPYVDNCAAVEHGSLGGVLRVIPMHGSWIPARLTRMFGPAKVSRFGTNVTHCRFIANEAECMFGGVDFNTVMETEAYVQHCLRVQLRGPGGEPAGIEGLVESIRKFTEHIVEHGNPHQLRLAPPLVGTTSVETSVKSFLLGAIVAAETEIFFENQYIEERELLLAIAQAQVKSRAVPAADAASGGGGVAGGRRPLRVVVVGNLDFPRNPYHPGKYPGAPDNCVSRTTAQTLRKETRGGLEYLRQQGCEFEFRCYFEKYTHNKICIFDRQVVCMGTFNLHRRAMVKGNDAEVGVTVTSAELADSYMTRVLDDTTVVEPEAW